MTIQERLAAFWAGERPDVIPFTIYQNEWRHTQDDPAWEALYQRGLGVTWHVPSVRQQQNEVEYLEQTTIENGHRIRRRIIRSPAGEVYETYVDGWHDQYYLKTPADYAVMTDIVRRTEVLPAYDDFLAQAERIAPYGIPLIRLGRTPLQRILVDLAGLEQFAYHLVDYEAELMALYQALLNNLRRTVELVAAGPGRFVSVLENFTAESMGPRRYESLLLPVYESLFPILQSSGKIVGTHYDGQLAACRALIAGAPIDLIESFTPPPEGDMTLTEARRAWPDKLLWSNINVACYYLPPQELHNLVLDRVAEAAPDGKRLAFEVSEQYPDNWKESLPVILDALQETRI